MLFAPGNLCQDMNTGKRGFSSSQFAVYGTKGSTDTTDLFSWDNVRSYATKPFEGVWRILSADEWNYLLFKRSNAEQLMGQATVGGICGLVILPDGWESPDDIAWQGFPDDFSVNTYNEAEWVALEHSGAVFLPAAGRRTSAEPEHVNQQGWYWAEANSGTHTNKCVCFGEGHVVEVPLSPSVEISLRLVQNAKQM